MHVVLLLLMLKYIFEVCFFRAYFVISKYLKAILLLKQIWITT